MDNFDTDEITRILADTNGAPQKILRNKADIDAKRQQKGQQEAAQQIIQGAPQAADAALKVAQIADMGQLGPSQS